MAGIALAESGGNTLAHNGNASTGDNSFGLWQINYFGNLAPDRTKRYGTPDQLLADPNRQAQAAISLAAGGKGLSNWTTFTSGAWKQYVQKGAIIDTRTGAQIGTVGQGAFSPVTGPGGALQTAQSLPGDIIGAITGPADLIKWIGNNWDRVALVVGGAVLLILGLVLLGGKAKAQAMAPAPANTQTAER
jgi:hypothetical protein